MDYQIAAREAFVGAQAREANRCFWLEVVEEREGVQRLVKSLGLRVWGLAHRGRMFFKNAGCHTVEYDRFIKSQLASRYSIQGLMLCKFGHVPRRF